MKPTIKLSKDYNELASVPSMRLADQIADMYVKLIEDLDGLGAGDGAWQMSVRLTARGYITVDALSQSRVADYAQSTRVQFNRSFELNEGRRIMGNNYLKLGQGLQGSGAGIADIVNTTGAQALDKWGGKIVRLHANLDVGGYAWLRKGFWPDAGRKQLDRRILASNELTQAQRDKWFALSDKEARAFVLTPEFSQYKPAFLGDDWHGEADISDAKIREAFTNAKRRAALAPAQKAATANELYRDAALRNQIGLRRYTSGVLKKISDLLERADADLALKLRTRLMAFEGRPADFTTERWKALLAEVRDARAITMQQYKDLTRSEVVPLGPTEAQRELNILTNSIPIEVGFATVAADQLRAIATSKPFQGKLLNDWFKDLEAVDQKRLVSTLQLGMVEGETTDNIVRKIIGTKANAYADGVLSISRRDATAIARTAINHVSNEARSYVWDANADVIDAKIWHATLDGRTSPICRARDGHGTPVGDAQLPPGVPKLVPPNARPPAHMNCRSLMVAYIDGVGLVGKRPVVTDTRTPDKRQIDFRAEAKRTGRPIQDVRNAWAAKHIGQVPASTNYQQFLSRQSAAFQDDVLGPTRGKLFRQGNLKVDQFVDRSGNELTLSELAAAQPKAFIAAGLDPSEF